jgi:hypothetical protein
MGELLFMAALVRCYLAILKGLWPIVIVGGLLAGMLHLVGVV